MRSHRSLAAGALFALAASGLVGCSAGGSSDSEAEGDGSGVVTMLALSNNKLGFDTAIEQFEAANPDIDIQVDYLDSTSLQTTLRTQLLAGTAPDVFTTWPGYSTPVGVARLAPMGHLEDLSDLPFSEELATAFDATTEIDGERVIFPFSLNYIGAFYNVQAVEAAAATVPATWSEVLEFCDAATAAGKVAFAYPAQALWAVQLPAFSLSASLVYGPDPSFSEEQAAGDATFSDSGWNEAFEKVTEMKDRGCFQSGLLATPIEQATDLVARGDALAVISTAATFGSVQAAAGESADIAMFILPATEEPEDTWAAASAGNGLSVNAKAENPVGAMRFMEFLSSPEVAAAAADAQSVAPVVMSAWERPADLEPLFELFDADRAVTLVDQTWPNPELAVMQQEGTQRLLDNATSVDDLLKLMDENYAAN